MFALIFLFFFPQKYQWLFIIAFLPGLISVFITFFIKENIKRSKTESKNNTYFFSYLAYWGKSSKNYKIILIGILAFTLFNSSDAFLLLFLKHRGYSDVQMIGYYIFYNLIYAIFSYPLGYMADKLGMWKTLIFGLILFVLVYTGFPFARNIYHFFILFFIYGIFAASNEGISKALISNISSKNETATAIGFLTSFTSIFTLLASTLGGVFFMLNPNLLFFISGIGVFLVVLFFIFISKLLRVE